MPVLRRVKPALWIVAALCIALPASASGAVTIGSDLEDNVGGPTLGNGYTVVQRTLDADDQASGGTTAPSEGVITGWRVKKGAGAATLALRVVRGNLSVFQSQPTVFPSAAGTYRFDTRVLVQAGDAIGVDNTGGGVPMIAGGGTWDYWSPLLGPTEERAPTASNLAQLLLNADLEPDADGDGFGDETQDGCPGNPLRQDNCSPDTGTPDTDPPETEITKTPPSTTSKTKAKYKFTSDDPNATFECKLKGKGLDQAVKQFGDCDSPRKYKGLDEGKFRFKVRAIDAAGNVDPTPAKDKFKVVG